MKHNFIRIAAMVLALFMLIPASLAACKRSPGTTEGTTAPDTGALPIETEPQDPDAFENTILLAADGQTAYTIVVPDYAAAWELKAADRLAATLAELGVTVTPAVDTATEAGAKEIVVGYTNRNSELAADFFEVGALGYHVAAIGEKLFVGANSESGMSEALARLTADLISDGNRLAIKQGYVCKVVGEPAAEDTPTLTGAYAESIAYANSVANDVQGYYTDAGRVAFTMANQTMSITHEMVEEGNRQISSMVNEYGVPYLRDTMSAYVETAKGRFYSKNSLNTADMNIFRYGAYYYETHIHGENFMPSITVDESVEPVDMLKGIKRATGNNLTAQRDAETGFFVISVTSKREPYMNFPRQYDVDADTYDTLLITMKTESSTRVQLWVAAGSYGGINVYQRITLTVVPGEMRTYAVCLKNLPDYEGTLKSLRMDFMSGSDHETVEIKDIKAVKTAASDVPALTLDRVLYTYPDKLHTSARMIATKEITDMTAYGMETAIEKSRVRSLLVIDGNGEHTSLEGVDWNTAVAVAFDVDRAGVFGYILTLDEGVGTMTVTEKDGYYVIDQKAAAKASYAEYEEINLGQRLYNDSTHNFDGFRKAVYEERNPLKVTFSTGIIVDKSLGYDALRGAYRVELDGTGFSQAYFQQPDRHYRVDVKVEGDAHDRNVYMYSYTTWGCLECAALLDKQERVLPYLLQVCKNFCGEYEEPVIDQDDATYGEVYFPLTVKSGERVEFSVINLYQNWGTFPLKQVSSIQFGIPYYHWSTGVNETNCNPSFGVNGKDSWLVTDHRAMSAPLVGVQHNGGGRQYFVQYTDAEGNYYAVEKTVDEIASHGPVYADVSMNQISDDGGFYLTYRHMEMPQTDENRTYYEIRMTALKDVSFKNFKEDFSFFSMDSNNMVYQTLGYLDENNKPVITTPGRTEELRYYTLGKESPFVSLSDTAVEEYVNLAVVIKDYEIIMSGEAFEGNVVLAEGKRSGLNFASLSFDLGEVTFKAGDTITINMILLPWGSQLTPKGDISNVLNVRNDTCLDPIKTDIKTGTLLPDTYMPKIKAEGGVAEFTLSGADNNMAVRVCGFNHYAKPIIEEHVGGAWVEYKTASVNGYDGYMAHYDGDGTYSFSFIVDMSNGDRTFRVKQDATATPDIPDKPEPDPVDPNQPDGFADPTYLAGVAASGHGIAGAEIKKENRLEFVSITVNSGDPQFNVGSSLGVLPNYLAIVYRTTAEEDGEMFIGTANGPNGQTDHVVLPWVKDGNWNLMLIDLSTVPNITDGNIGYFRLDPFRGQVEGSLDVAYIGFFNTAESAASYAANFLSKPIAMADPAYLAVEAASGNDVAVGEVTTEDNRTFVRLTATGGDPYFSILNPGANVQSDILAIAYRTNSKAMGEFYVGSGAGITAQGDHFNVNWMEGGWNLMVIDLSTVESLTSITGDMVNFLRIDFFTNAGSKGDYFDIEYVAFFESVAAAEAYYNILHRPTAEEPSEPDPGPVDPMAPVSIFEAADLATITRPDLGSLTPDCVSIVDNYLHIVPIGPDPYWYPFFNVDGARYVVIRYRTNATGVDTQFYIGSYSGAPTGDHNSLKQPVIADGEWHLAIFDTQPIIDLGLYDGSYVSFFRFDVLEGIHNDDDGGRYPLPEGCYVDVEYVAFFHSPEAAEEYDRNLHDMSVDNGAGD